MISKNQLKLVHQLVLKKYRKREGLFVAEGPKVVGDLLKKVPAHMLFATEAWLLENSGKPCADSQGIVMVTEEELQKLSFLQHPQQVLGLFPIPSFSISQFPFQMMPDTLYLALDSVQDPGNLGTIIRIADWFGIDTIFCSEDTADAWNPKVVQATMGSIARVHIIYCDLSELLTSTTVPVYGTLLDGQNIYEHPLTQGGIIVMGNEGNGISAPIRQLITQRLFIPDFHQGETADSLNVAIATAITCSEFRRRG